MLKLIRRLFGSRETVRHPTEADYAKLRTLPIAPKGKRYCFNLDGSWSLVDIPAEQKPAPLIDTKELRGALRRMRKQIDAAEAAAKRRRPKKAKATKARRKARL